MLDIKYLEQLELHGNVNTFEFCGKTIVLYDDHRWILNMLFEASKLKIFRGRIPNVIYFDHHDDALSTHINLRKLNVSNVLELSSRDFWAMVDFDLNSRDDTWVTAGMELGLINNVVCIGQEANNNIESWEHNTYTDVGGVPHKGFCIGHILDEHREGGVFDRRTRISPYIWQIFDYGEGGFYASLNNPFVLDFDLDCFTYEEDGKTRAWSEQHFKDYYANPEVNYFMCTLFDRASFITICREPKCCGGLGESNKILCYLDKYFFDGCLKTVFQE